MKVVTITSSKESAKASRSPASSAVPIDGTRILEINLASAQAIATLPGLPSTAIPLGLSKDGLPVGAQILGPFLEDRTPLKLAELMLEVSRRMVSYDSLDDVLDDFFFDKAYAHALGAARPRADGTPSGQVVNLDVRRRIATLPIAGMPHLGSGITFAYKGSTVLASPNLQVGSGGGAVDVIDMTTWKPVTTIATPGPGFFMRSHEATPYAWTDSMMSPTARDTLTIIDKRTLEVVAQVREPTLARARMRAMPAYRRTTVISTLSWSAFFRRASSSAARSARWPRRSRARS